MFDRHNPDRRICLPHMMNDSKYRYCRIPFMYAVRFTFRYNVKILFSYAENKRNKRIKIMSTFVRNNKNTKK